MLIGADPKLAEWFNIKNQVSCACEQKICRREPEPYLENKDGQIRVPINLNLCDPKT